MSVDESPREAAAPVRETARFGHFKLDLDVGELRRDGELVSLRPKAVDVLVLLVRRAGRLVPRDRIVEGVWGDTHVDVDAALHTAIREVRQALDDDASQPVYVETVHRRGYRFVADVELEAGRRDVGVAAAADAGPPGLARRATWALVATALVLLATAVVFSPAAEEPGGEPSLSPAAAPPELTASPAVLRGRYLVNHGSPEDLEAGVNLLRDAVTAADGGVLAWSGLAIAEMKLARYQQAWHAASRALEMEARSPEALRVLGQLAVVLGRDLGEAESRLLRALELDPASGKAQHAYGVFLAASGRVKEAIRMAEAARALAPGAFVIRANLARYRLYDHDLPGAVEEARAVLREVPGHAPTLETLQVASWLRGDVVEARDAAVELAGWRGAPDALVTELRQAPAEAGLRKALRWRIVDLEGHRGADRHVWLALLRVQLGDLEGAVAELERLGDRASPLLPISLQDPRLDPLRDHQVVRRLMARYRMPTSDR